jgi:hypothetical protein
MEEEKEGFGNAAFCVKQLHDYIEDTRKRPSFRM